MNWKELKPFNKGMVTNSQVGIGQEAIETIRDAHNIRLRSGNIVAREGWVTLCDFNLCVGISGKTIHSLGEYKRESYDPATEISTIWKAIVFSTGNALWYARPEDSTQIAVKIDDSTFTNWTFKYVNLYDHLWLFNKVDPVYIWDGSSVKLAGIPAPQKTFPLCAVNNPGGGLFIRYKFAYYSQGIPYNKESEVTEAYTLSGCGGAVPGVVTINNNVDCSPELGETIDAQVTHIRIYRTIYWDPATDETPTGFYLLAEWILADAIAASYIYNDIVSTDVSLGTPFDDIGKGVPPVSRYALWHDSRLFLAGDPQNPSLIYYSEAGKPWYFPTLNYDEVNRDDGAIITGIGAIGPTRYIFKNTVIYEWTGNPETATPIRQVERPDSTMNMNRVAVGCHYPNTLVGWKNSLIFRAQDGDVYMITPDRLVNLSQYYQGTRGLISDCWAYIKNDYYYIGDTVETFVCYLPTGAWESNDSIGLTGILVRDDNSVIEPRADTLRLLLSGTTDDGTPFPKIVQTRYTKLITSDSDIAIIRGVMVQCSVRVAFTVTIYNEKGGFVTGVIAATDRKYTVPHSTPLRGKFASIRIAWFGDTEIYSISVGYMRRIDHVTQ